MFSELNCGYYFHIFFEDKTNPRSRFYSADKLAKKLRKLMLIHQQNPFYAQKLQKQAHNKIIKPQNYVSSEKIWLNSR